MSESYAIVRIDEAHARRDFSVRHDKVKRDAGFLVGIGEMRVVVDGGSNAKPADETDAAAFFHAKV